MYSFRTLIYYEKTIELWKKNLWFYGKTMALLEELWYYTETYVTLIYYEKTMVL